MVTKQPQGRPVWHRSWNEHESSSLVGVFIDGDGISHKCIETILSEAASMGSLLVPRVFGNWELPTLQGWQRLLIPYRLEQRHHRLATPGKNATDIALVIDVLESTYQYGIRKFCLAVADSDYTPLVAYQRTIGCTVLVLGTKQTVPTLKEVCHRFVALDEPVLPIPTDEKQAEDDGTASPCTGEDLVFQMIEQAYDSLAQGTRVWITLPDVERCLKARNPAFSAGSSGYKNVYRLIKARLSNRFETRSKPSQPHIQEIRRKESQRVVSPPFHPSVVQG